MMELDMDTDYNVLRIIVCSLMCVPKYVTFEVFHFAEYRLVNVCACVLSSH